MLGCGVGHFNRVEPAIEADTADIVQRRLGVDLGLPASQPLPPVQSRQAADVTRRVMAWAAQIENADPVSRTDYL